MFGNELLKGIERQMPALYESLKEFGGRGIRGAVAHKLKISSSSILISFAI